MNTISIAANDFFMSALVLFLVQLFAILAGIRYSRSVSGVLVYFLGGSALGIVGWYASLYILPQMV